MGLITLRPNGTTSPGFGWTYTGAATAHQAWNDNSDSSYGSFATDGTQAAVVTCPPPALPPGALVKLLALRARARRTGSGYTMLRGSLVTGSGELLFQTEVNWSTPTTVTIGQAATSVVPTAPSIALLGVFLTTSPLDVYELYYDVTYVAKPTLTVTGPSGTLTNTNLPTVSWAPTLDSDGGAQYAWTAKIFSASQYSAPGFTPATSTPIAAMEAASAATAWQSPTPLPDGTYRAFARVAQFVNGAPFWSDWTYIEFTVAVPRPAAPSLTATAQSSHARIRLDAAPSGGPVSTDRIEMARSLDDGQTWAPLRTVEGDGVATPASTGAVAFDLEAPNGAMVRYRARALHSYSGVFAASDWTESQGSWSSNAQWLKHPTKPWLSMPVVIDAYPTRQRPGRLAVQQPIGRSDPVVVSDTRGGATGSVRLRLDTEAEQGALDVLLDELVPLLLQPGADDHRPERWVRIADHDREHAFDKAFVEATLDTLQWTEVARPNGDMVGWPGQLLPGAGLLPSDSLLPTWTDD